MTVTKEQLLLEFRKELARRDFFEFCKLSMPSFYKEERGYLKNMCNALQDFYESDNEVAVINVPPRHGKSLSATMFAKWVFGKNSQEKIMTGSYNETLSTNFSKAVRNGIGEVKGDESILVYSDIFPATRIKYGEAAMNLWALDGAYASYLATSPTGTATGFGASLLIIDDLIKSSEEAHNAGVLEKHWDWYANTMISRLEAGGKILIIMTRWNSKDLAGRALQHYKEEGKKVLHINLKALQDDGTMLCDDVLDRAAFDSKMRLMSPEIASANYQQEPIDLKGRLYTTQKTYSGELPTFKYIKNYTDTADTGADYLCSVNYGVTFNDEAYILDVLYTKEPMELTEPATAALLNNGLVNQSDIESNNGGRGFARAVERLMKTTHRTNRVRFNAFHQSKNKQARILSNATWVMDHIYFPEDWRHKYPDFYKDVTEYQKTGKNAHDDAPDVLTGIAERAAAGDRFSFN